MCCFKTRATAEIAPSLPATTLLSVEFALQNACIVPSTSVIFRMAQHACWQKQRFLMCRLMVAAITPMEP